MQLFIHSFCARHRIELFLKDCLLKFKEIRGNAKINEKLLQSTHDLERLWDIFKKVAEDTDRRFLTFKNDAEEYVLDFSEMNATGETFRYTPQAYVNA